MTSLELLGASFELLGAFIGLLGASIELLEAAFELLGPPLELLGAALKLREAARQLMGWTVEVDDVGGTITERRLIRARRIWIEEAKETDEERGQALGDGLCCRSVRLA